MEALGVERQGRRVGLAQLGAGHVGLGRGEIQHRLIEIGGDEPHVRRQLPGERLGDDAGSGGGFEQRA